MKQTKMKYPVFILHVLFMLMLVQTALNGQGLTTSAYFEPPLSGRNYLWLINCIGSPLLLDKWLEGSVILKTHDTVDNKLLNMDCWKNNLLWYSKERGMVAVDKNSIEGFDLKLPQGGIRSFRKVALRRPLETDTALLYLETLHEGRISLYAYRKVTVTDQITNGNGGLVSIHQFINEPNYYVRVESKPLMVVRFKRGNISRFFAENELKIKDILKNKHIRKIKNEEQLLNAIKIIDANW